MCVMTATGQHGGGSESVVGSFGGEEVEDIVLAEPESVGVCPSGLVVESSENPPRAVGPEATPARPLAASAGDGEGPDQSLEAEEGASRRVEASDCVAAAEIAAPMKEEAALKDEGKAISAADGGPADVDDTAPGPCHVTAGSSQDGKVQRENDHGEKNVHAASNNVKLPRLAKGEGGGLAPAVTRELSSRLSDVSGDVPFVERRSCQGDAPEGRGSGESTKRTAPPKRKQIPRASRRKRVEPHNQKQPQMDRKESPREQRSPNEEAELLEEWRRLRREEETLTGWLDRTARSSPLFGRSDSTTTRLRHQGTTLVQRRAVLESHAETNSDADVESRRESSFRNSHMRRTAGIRIQAMPRKIALAVLAAPGIRPRGRVVTEQTTIVAAALLKKATLGILLALAALTTILPIHQQRTARHSSRVQGMNDNETTSQFEKDDGFEPLRVLVARTVSPAETDVVIADVMHVRSYGHAKSSHQGNGTASNLLDESLSQCDRIREWLYPDVFELGSETFPNRMLCHPDRRNAMADFYALVEVDFLLFAQDQSVRDTLSAALVAHSIGDVEVLDVSDNAVKLWNWIIHLDATRLKGYDYTWMIDGDVLMKSLNWQAFWQQVRLTRPRVSQPCIIGTGPGGKSSKHYILRHPADARVMAAETAIIEVMAPLFEVETWLGYRRVVTEHPQVLQHIHKRGEDCFDLSWCHYARANLTGEQLRPQRGSLKYDPNAPSMTDEGAHHRSCMVFYQTPIVHSDKRSLEKDNDFKREGQAVCRFMQNRFHIHWTVESVYELFVDRG